jgi:hypothetical protein
VKIERVRENVFTLTGTSQELAALVAAARMARDAMLDDPHAPPDALTMLERVIDDYDKARQRLE